MYVLVACECSQVVCNEFRKRGHLAFSCDIKKSRGGHPEWHICSDVLPLLNGCCSFTTEDSEIHFISCKWDLIIAHPPCTYLTLSCNKYYDIEKYKEKALERRHLRELAVEFFLTIYNADCDKIAIENPVGYMSSHFRKPDMIYNPYDFLPETESKRTCLWLKGLPKLIRTRSIPLCKSEITHNGYRAFFNGKQYSWNDSEVAYLRSVTPYGVAKAMAEQWG